MVPVNVYAYAVLSTPHILGFTSGYILIFLRGTPQNLTRLHAYASGSPDDPCKLTFEEAFFKGCYDIHGLFGEIAPTNNKSM